MLSLTKGRYRVRIAETADDVRAAQRLRWLCFIGQRAPAASDAGNVATSGNNDVLDADDHDAACVHMLVEHQQTGVLVACFRLLHLSGGAEIGRSYAARYYNLAALADYAGPMVELGRFCVHPAYGDPDILRVAWAALARYVDAKGVGMLFGCSSFTGTDTARYQDSFAVLRERHLAPRRWLPRVKSPDVFRFGRLLRRHRPDMRAAMAAMPPLLRTYLLMGGWVSDHAVVDRQLDTLHVFTGLEVGAIPPRRAAALRAAGAAG